MLFKYWLSMHRAISTDSLVLWCNYSLPFPLPRPHYCSSVHFNSTVKSLDLRGTQPLRWPSTSVLIHLALQSFSFNHLNSSRALFSSVERIVRYARQQSGLKRLWQIRFSSDLSSSHRRMCWTRRELAQVTDSGVEDDTNRARIGENGASTRRNPSSLITWRFPLSQRSLFPRENVLLSRMIDDGK